MKQSSTCNIEEKIKFDDHWSAKIDNSNEGGTNEWFVTVKGPNFFYYSGKLGFKYKTVSEAQKVAESIYNRNKDLQPQSLIDFIKTFNVQVGDIFIEGSSFNTHYTFIGLVDDFVRVSYEASYGKTTKILENTLRSHWKLPTK
jgi:hypothetical protein